MTATALPKQQTTDFKHMAIQAQQLKDNTGAAVDMTELTALSGTTATPAQINAAAALITVPAIAAGATLSPTLAQSGKTILLDTLAGSVVTLPAATGAGTRYKFVTKVVPTSNAHEIATDNTATFYGAIEFDKSGTVTNYTSQGTNKAVKLNGTTTGAAGIGDIFEVIDVDTNKWAIYGFTQASGTLATPFSATV